MPAPHQEMNAKRSRPQRPTAAAQGPRQSLVAPAPFKFLSFFGGLESVRGIVSPFGGLDSTTGFASPPAACRYLRFRYFTTPSVKSSRFRLYMTGWLMS